MDSLSDNAIMLQVKAGNTQKMSLLFERHYRALYSFIFHMTYKKEASEDMVQNVFYRMLKYSHTFKADGEFIYWMFHIARNVLNEHLKKNKNQLKHSVLEVIEEYVEDQRTVEDLYEKKEEKKRLYEALAKLNKEDREVISLSRIHELKHKEISQLLGLSEGAVRVRVHRAFRELKCIFIKLNN